MWTWAELTQVDGMADEGGRRESETNVNKPFDLSFPSCLNQFSAGFVCRR